MCLRVQQRLGVVLTVDIHQCITHRAQHSHSTGRTVDLATAFALGRNPSVKHQRTVRLRLQTQIADHSLHGRVHPLKEGAYHCLGRTVAHQLPGCALAKNGIDRVHHNGLTGTGLTCEHIQPGVKLHRCLFNHGNIFNFQHFKHGASSPNLR